MNRTSRRGKFPKSKWFVNSSTALFHNNLNNSCSSGVAANASTDGATTMTSGCQACSERSAEHDNDEDESSSMATESLDTSTIPRVVVAENPEEQRVPQRPSIVSAKVVVSANHVDATTPPAQTHQPPMDLEREKTKMESFDCYILVSVLTATSSFSTLQAFEPLEDVRDCWFHHTLMVLTQISAGMSTICGLYATVVFSLTVLYAKSAIGMHRDATYQYFMQQTAPIRVRGFRAFSASLLSFAMEAGLVTFLRIPKIARLPVLVCVVALLHYICTDWQHIVATATVIYTGKIPAPVPSAEKKRV